VTDTDAGRDARVLDAKLAAARDQLRARGWTDADLAAFERRKLIVRAGATELERRRLLLALYLVLPPLPEVEVPESSIAARGIDPGMLAKVRALLAKAESTTFPEEAESLSAKAQELMSRHRIDAVLVDRGTGGGPAGRRIWIDDPYAEPKVRLLSAVARANGCRAIEIGRLGCVQVMGFPADLEVVELLHTSLLVQAASAMHAAGPQVDARGRSRTRSFRRSFLLAYAWRIGERIREANAATEAVADAQRGGDLLPVLRRRDADVDAAVQEVFPDLRDRRAATVTNAAGWGAGVAAADRADLDRRPRVGGAPRGAITR
jgi:hypothetical protein